MKAQAMKKQDASSRSGDIFNPATGEVVGQVKFDTAADVNKAVEKAKAALPAWSETTPMKRARIMFRFLELLNKHADELAKIVSTEHGKVAIDAAGEVQRGIEI